MAKKIALEVKNISKSFRLPTEQASGIKQAFVNWTRGINGYKEQQVLKNISFSVEEGDFFGVVGRNGSGKSTLLKLISQIYVPDSGEIKVNGKLVPFIELGVGFNPELTGRENVYLNGALLGFSHDEVSAMYGDIVEFAELEEFMDQKLKNYSSGMQVRLAFSIAIKADADILVLDEVLAVGDEAFQRKCFGYFAELKRNKKTVILVTHSMDYILKFCNKAALIDKGHKLEVGDPSEIAHLYRSLNTQTRAQRRAINDKLIGTMIGDINLESSYEMQKNDSRVSIFTNISSNKKLQDVVITFVLYRDTGEPVVRWVTDENIDSVINLVPGRPIGINLTLQNIFPSGEYRVQIGVKKADRSEDYLIVEDALHFDVAGNSTTVDGMYWAPVISYNLKRANE